jgi:thioredoxin-related protein
LAKPVVDGLERRLEDGSTPSPQAQVLRLNVTDSVGRRLAIRYGVRRVPTLVLLDGSGNVLLKQVGTPRRDEIIEAVEQLAD